MYKCIPSRMVTVVAYLALFRLDELGMSHFRRIIYSLNLAKMHRVRHPNFCVGKFPSLHQPAAHIIKLNSFQFLNFALCEKHLITWMKDEWGKYYDRSFVQTTLLSPILRYMIDSHFVNIWHILFLLWDWNIDCFFRWLPELEEMICHLKKKLDAKIKLKKPEIKSTGKV